MNVDTMTDDEVMTKLMKSHRPRSSIEEWVEEYVAIMAGFGSIHNVPMISVKPAFEDAPQPMTMKIDIFFKPVAPLQYIKITGLS